MITVEQADNIIGAQVRDFGAEDIPYEHGLGRCLVENLFADRNMPPFDRSTVDGIAIRYQDYEKGILSFKIKATQSAGEHATSLEAENECIEIMTGASVDSSVDTIIRYEDLSIDQEIVSVNCKITKGQNIHWKGSDKKKGDLLVPGNQVITPAIVGIASSIGKTVLSVKKLPKVLIISTGDEMVCANTTPSPTQLRRSNGITIQSALLKYNIFADSVHLPDDYSKIKETVESSLQKYDVILTTGGVSMGKYDYLPAVCKEIGVQKLFHSIKQKPGKPFWFGKSNTECLIFGFPGNPVSVFLCLHRYFIPWLEACLYRSTSFPHFAVLQQDLSIPVDLQFFAQVKLSVSPAGQVLAVPVDTNGSGDFSRLVDTHAFMELPASSHKFKKGEVYKIWKYNF